jgi:hypothetical protein
VAAPLLEVATISGSTMKELPTVQETFPPAVGVPAVEELPAEFSNLSLEASPEGAAGAVAVWPMSLQPVQLADLPSGPGLDAQIVAPESPNW